MLYSLGYIVEIITFKLGKDMAAIYGTSENDIFDSDLGNDSIYSHSGRDIIYFGVGSGHDTIYPYSTIAPVDNDPDQTPFTIP